MTMRDWLNDALCVLVRLQIQIWLRVDEREREREKLFLFYATRHTPVSLCVCSAAYLANWMQNKVNQYDDKQSN